MDAAGPSATAGRRPDRLPAARRPLTAAAYNYSRTQRAALSGHSDPPYF